MRILISAFLSCTLISDNHWCNHPIKSRKAYKTEICVGPTIRNGFLIRSNFRTEMSNFSNSIKYVGNLLNVRILPVEKKRDCSSAHLFGFSQQSGLKYRPHMSLQSLTQKYMQEIGALVRTSSSLNKVPDISTEHAYLKFDLIDGDIPSNSEKQYGLYCSHLRRIRKANRRGEVV